MKEMKQYVIYSRKSKFTGKGESIENQVEMCRKYIATHFGEVEAKRALVFEDEYGERGDNGVSSVKKYRPYVFRSVRLPITLLISGVISRSCASLKSFSSEPYTSSVEI